MQHTNCVLYVLITHCHKYTAVVVNMQEILFVLQEIMQYSACGHVSLECYRVLQHTQKSKHICNFLFRLWLSVTDSLTRHTSHHMRPLFLQRRCSLSIPLACIADCIFPPAYCCSFHNWKSLTVRKRQKEGRHYHTAQNKSLICHTAFLCKPDLYAQLRCFVWLDVHVLSAGGFQKQGPLGYVYLLCCQLVRADTD